MRAVFEDSKNRLWVGTNGGGLNLFDYVSETFKAVTESDGLPSNIIQAIVEDNDGNLWLATNNGITRYNHDTGEISTYDKNYGLQGNEFNVGSAYKARNGDLIFGGLDGYTRFNPRDIQENSIIPPVVFTDIEILNQPVAIEPSGSLEKSIVVAEQIHLNYLQNILTLKFAALNYRNSENNVYAYKLEGFDKDWYSVGQKRSATYTNLDAGTYTFKVRAANNEGVWNELGKELKIIVTPPPWKTWWAYSLYALLVLGVIFTYVSYQTRINRLLEEKVRDRTAELEAANEKLEAVSLSDPLTGLGNRRFLEKFISADIAQISRKHRDWQSDGNYGEPNDCDVAFYLIDVDHFKSVNDTYGHSVGDKVLITIANLLKDINRESSYVIRWGGEEFLLVSRFVDRHHTDKLADRILDAVRKTKFEMSDGRQLNLTCSIGFSILPYSDDENHIVDWKRTIDVADIALYAAKNSGRNGWVGTNISKRTIQSPEEFHELVRQGKVTVYSSFGSGTKLVWE